MVLASPGPLLDVAEASYFDVLASMCGQFDMLLTGDYTSETVIEFLYKYTSHDARGTRIWESRVSRW
jgi:predicted HD phosphohydrolase